MKKIDLGQAITILANAGVLAGLLLLAFELNQNHEMTRAQTRSEISRQITDFLGGVAGDAELASLMRRAQAGEELTVDEEWQYFLLWSANVRFWENIHYQYRQDLFDEAEFEAERTGWRKIIQGNTVFAKYWCSATDGYSAEFVAEINSLLERPC